MAEDAKFTVRVMAIREDGSKVFCEEREMGLDEPRAFYREFCEKELAVTPRAQTVSIRVKDTMRLMGIAHR